MANSDSESEEGKLILIMGVAGAGKTSFINRLTPEDFGIENTSLSVGISGFDEYPVKIGGKTITLVDTPGADTTEAIFEETIQWLERRDSPDRSVFGIVLLLPILSPRLDRRMFSQNLLSGFRKLLDPGLDLRTELHRVVLATTMWTQNQDPHERDKIQSQLRGEWWPLLKRGAQLWECTNTPEFAQAVIDHVLTAQRPHTTVIRSSLIIAVIGLTGSGKSSFIAALTNDFSFSQDAVAEDDVYAFVIEINKQKVILLDTPGLDYRENRGAVFDVISSWLLKKAREISKPQLYLDGVVLTHSILSRHTRGVVPQSLLIDHINPLLGLETIRDKRDIKAYHRVILATTMWDRVHEKDTRDAEEREREIRNHNWNILSTAGAGVMRFDNTAKSAHRITKKIVEERVSGDAVYELRKNVMEELSNLKLDVNSLSKTANPVLLELIYPAATTAGHS